MAIPSNFVVHEKSGAVGKPLANEAAPRRGYGTGSWAGEGTLLRKATQIEAVGAGS